jgi:hypothetical protein
MVDMQRMKDVLRENLFPATKDVLAVWTQKVTRLAVLESDVWVVIPTNEAGRACFHKMAKREVGNDMAGFRCLPLSA